MATANNAHAARRTLSGGPEGSAAGEVVTFIV
jgi:hypothetical protein